MTAETPTGQPPAEGEAPGAEIELGLWVLPAPQGTIQCDAVFADAGTVDPSIWFLQHGLDRRPLSALGISMTLPRIKQFLASFDAPVREQYTTVAAADSRFSLRTPPDRAAALAQALPLVKYRASFARVGIAQDGVMIDFFNADVVPPQVFNSIKESERTKLIAPVVRVFASLVVFHDLLTELDRVISS